MNVKHLYNRRPRLWPLFQRAYLLRHPTQLNDLHSLTQYTQCFNRALTALPHTGSHDKSGCGTRMLSFCADAVKAVKAARACPSMGCAAVGEPRICELGDASNSFSPSLQPQPRWLWYYGQSLV